MSRSSANLTGQAVILVIMYVKIFSKSDSCQTCWRSRHTLSLVSQLVLSDLLKILIYIITSITALPVIFAENLDIHKSDRTSCDTSDNVCRDLQQNLTRQAVILVIMYVEIFSKSDRTSCDTSDNVSQLVLSDLLKILIYIITSITALPVIFAENLDIHYH
jgi:small-conductance mechanosensitive channel